MSAPGDSTQSESALNKPEESTNSAIKADPIESNEEASVNNPADIAKKEIASQSVSNGALAESETKVVPNGLETAMNGQEEKPSDGPPRPIPDLLPLATSPTPVTQPSSNAVNSAQPPKQNTNSQPLTLNTTASPVVATKSAPPPPSSPAKTRGRNSSPAVTLSSPIKEAANISTTVKATESKEEKPSDEKKETKKRKPVAKKRDSVASSGECIGI